MPGTALSLVDWEGFLGVGAVLLGCLALRSWLLGPAHRFPALRLERRAPLVEAPMGLILPQILGNTSADRAHTIGLGAQTDHGVGRAGHIQAMPRTRPHQ
jgi:hypothetical protein